MSEKDLNDYDEITKLPFFDVETKVCLSDVFYSDLQLRTFTSNHKPVLDFSKTNIIVNETSHHRSAHDNFLWEAPLANEGHIAMKNTITFIGFVLTGLLCFILRDSFLVAPVMFFMMFLTLGYRIEASVNASYYNSLAYSKRDVNLLKKERVIFKNYLTQRMINTTSELTEEENSFIELVDKFAVNKNNVPFFTELSKYLVRIETIYGDKREQEKRNNLSHKNSSQMLSDCVTKVEELCQDYFIQEVPYTSNKLQRKPLLKLPFKLQKEQNTLAITAPTKLDSNKSITSSTLTKQEYAHLHGPNQKITYLEEQLKTLLIQHPNETQITQYISRLDRIKKDYNMTLQAYEKAQDNKNTKKLNNEAHKMLDYFQKQIEETQETLQEYTMSNFMNNWSIITSDESSLNIPKTQP